MGRRRHARLDELPRDVLQKIFEVAACGANDLARLEVASPRFCEPVDGFKSIIERTAFQYCNSDVLFCRLPSPLQSELLRRCQGFWKLVWRFLEAISGASRGMPISRDIVGQILKGKTRGILFLITEVGALMGCGVNNYGLLNQSRQGQYCKQPIPLWVSTGTRVMQVSAKYRHAAFVTEDGMVYTYGKNFEGQCGHGYSSRQVVEPKLVESLCNVFCTQVSTSEYHTTALTKEGDVYFWGYDFGGPSGRHDDQEAVLRPQLIESLSSIGEAIHVDAASNHTLCVMRNGDLYGFGRLWLSSLASTFPRSSPHKVEFVGDVFVSSVAYATACVVVLDALGQVYTWGETGSCVSFEKLSKLRPRIVSALSNVRVGQISVHNGINIYVQTDAGKVFSFDPRQINTSLAEVSPESDCIRYTLQGRSAVAQICCTRKRPRRRHRVASPKCYNPVAKMKYPHGCRE